MLRQAYDLKSLLIMILVGANVATIELRCDKFSFNKYYSGRLTSPLQMLALVDRLLNVDESRMLTITALS